VSDEPRRESDATVLVRLLQISALSLGVVTRAPAAVEAARKPRPSAIESSPLSQAAAD